MRITGWHVDGYGRFRDEAWRDLPAGLTVFHGPNEAGKSTLLSFLQVVLFGFPRANAARLRPAVPALRGGAHGGRIFLADGAGAEWTVERLRAGDVRIVGPGDAARGPADLQRLLGHVTPEVFQSVFAFSLQELEALGGLDDDAVRDRLFAAGLTGVGRSAHDALGVLEKRASTLYRRQSSSVLRDLHERLRDLREERRIALGRVAEHGPLRAAEAAAEDRVAAAEAGLDELRREDRRLDRLQQLWQILVPLDRDVAALRELSAGPEVPADAVTELRALDEQLLGLDERLVEHRRDLERRADARDERSVDPRLVAVADDAARLAERVPVQRDRLAAHRTLAVERRRADERADEAVARVGPGWDRARVLAADVSVPVRTAAAAWARRTEAAERDLRAAEDAEVEARRVAEDAEVGARRAAEDAEGGARRVAEDADAEPGSAAVGPGSRARGRDGVPVLLVVAALALVAAAALVASGQVAGGGVVVLVGLAVGWAHLAERRTRTRARRRRDAEVVAAGQDAEERAARAADEHRRAAEAVGRATLAAERTAGAVRDWLADHGLPEDLEAGTIAPLLAALDEARERALAADLAADRAADVADRLASWADHAVRALRAAGRPVPGEPRHGALSGSAGPRASLPGRGESAAGEATAVGLASPVGRSVDDEALIDAVIALAGDVAAASAAAAEKAQARRDDAADLAVIERLAVRRDARAAARAELLATYAVPDAPGLHAAARRTAERDALRAAVAGREAEARRVAGDGPDAEALRDDARSGGVEEWAARRVAIRDGLRVRQDELRAAIEARTVACGRREALEADADLARIDGGIEEVRAEAAAALVEYRTVLRAQGLIGDTLAAFVRDRQPAVLRDASRWFAQVTDGRFVAVRQATDAPSGRGGRQQPLRVDTASGRELDPTALSRGTREQLYLCLRLALARSTAAEGTALPLVMDDVLVNVSPDRAAAVARVLADVAAEQQVLFFTCHPTTRDLLVEATGGSVRVEELERATA